MPAALPLLLFLSGGPCPGEAPPGEANDYVRALVGAQQRREEALSRYAYDVREERERLDGDGRARHRSVRVFEVFHVEGRPVRRLVSRDGRALAGAEREGEDRRVLELVEAIRGGRAASERPGVRLSRILERFDFVAAGGERIEERCTLVFDFASRPGDYELDRDELLRQLSGRLWVDEAERELVRLEVEDAGGLRFALGLGGSLSALSFTMSFSRFEDGVWLPRRLEAHAEGRRFPFRRFRHRITTTYSGYRRFGVDVDEEIRE